MHYLTPSRRVDKPCGRVLTPVPMPSISTFLAPPSCPFWFGSLSCISTPHFGVSALCCTSSCLASTRDVSGGPWTVISASRYQSRAWFQRAVSAPGMGWGVSGPQLWLGRLLLIYIDRRSAPDLPILALSSHSFLLHSASATYDLAAGVTRLSDITQRLRTPIRQPELQQTSSAYSLRRVSPSPCRPAP